MTAELAAQEQESPVDAGAEPRSLPSGRSVVVRAINGQEEIEIRSPDGDMEVRIVLTAQGPVVQLRAAQLHMEALDTVSVTCGRFAVEAREEVRLQSDGNVQLTATDNVRIESTQDTHVNGKMIYLNC